MSISVAAGLIPQNYTIYGGVTAPGAKIPG
jgi:hypothetical protein